MNLKVLIAGASGVIGRRLCPQLLSAGYCVYGTTRNEEGAVSSLAAADGRIGHAVPAALEVACEFLPETLIFGDGQDQVVPSMKFVQRKEFLDAGAGPKIGRLRGGRIRIENLQGAGGLA
jgi:nucleoside-diphosphate-sugar epimerase